MAAARLTKPPPEKTGYFYYLMIRKILNLKQSLSDINGINLKNSQLGEGKPLGRLPCGLSKVDESHSIAPSVLKSNRYLEYQERKILELVKKQELDKAVILGCILLKNSKAYQFSLYNRVVRTWYGSKTIGEALREFKICSNKLRKGDISLTLKRFYLDKGFEKIGIPNGKLRPIGSPTIPSKLLTKSINDLVYVIHRNSLKDFQHGYRLNRGTHTALYEVGKKIAIEQKNFVMEFDFKAFFNTVNASGVFIAVREQSIKLALLIKRIIANVEYTFDRNITNLPEGESEIILVGKSKMFKVKENKGEKTLGRYQSNPKYFIEKPLIKRKGLPQGLSISPVLATMVVEWLKPPAGLVMYADDGLIIREDENFTEFEEGCVKLRNFGVEIEPTKTGLTNGTFKFLGVEFDLNKKEVKYKEAKETWRGWDTKSPDLGMKMQLGFKNVAQFYGKKSEGGTWEIKINSMAGSYRNKIGGGRRLITTIIGLGSATNYRGYRYFLGKGCYNISGLSTQCCEDMMKHLKDITLVGKRKLMIPAKPKREYVHVNRGKYFERNLNSVNGFTLL